MKETRVASRYAKSLLDLARERDQVESVYNDMVLVRTAVQDNRELNLLLDSPIIKSDKKEAILQQIFAGKIGEVSQKFINILVNKRREHLIDDVAGQFEEQYLAINNVVTAEVVSAIALNEEQRAEVLKVVQSLKSGTDVKLTEKVDKDIIGGLIIRVGDQQLDSSVSGRLEKYRQEFSKNQYIAEF